MAIKRTGDSKHDAVGIALPSALPRRRVASDLGVGNSTLGKISIGVSASGYFDCSAGGYGQGE